MQLVRDGCRAVHSVVFKVHGRLPGLPIPATDPHPSVAEAKLVRLLSEQTGLPSAGDPAVVRGHAIACTGLPEIKGEGIETLHRGLACSINYTCYILVNT